MTTVRVPAKINLALRVGPVRDDGFHQLATVYQAVDLHDEIRATISSDGNISVSVQFDSDRAGERGSVPENDDNLAVSAAQLLRHAAGIQDGVYLAIRKAIPVAGGMAGGSADAAASLLACNELWSTGLTRSELEELGAKLGSDVPFALRGGNALGTGRGERVSPILARGSYHWVFAVASEGLSTASVYAEFDRLNADRDVAEPKISDELLGALRAGDAEALGRALTNDLSDAALSLRPELTQTLAVGLECDALGAMISGSGPTAIFLARDDKHALDISFALSSSRVCADVVQATGPIPGARLV